MDSARPMKQDAVHIFFLKKKVLFPDCTLAVSVGRSEASGELRKGDRVLVAPLRFTLDLLRFRPRIATIAEVTEVRADLKTVRMSLKGLMRVRLTETINFKKGRYELLEAGAVESHESIGEELRKKSQELVFLINVEESDRLIGLLNYIVGLNQLTDFIANYFVLDFPARYRLYNETDIKKRSRMLISDLDALMRRMTEQRKKRIYEKNSNRE